MTDAMRAVCDAALDKGVRLLPAAEPQNAQAEVDRWTTTLAADYNKRTPGYALLYHTYQCYLESVPRTLSTHLAEAASHEYTLGVKLVRGAYLDTEQRNLIWDTREETHAAYDGIVHDLLRMQYGEGIPAPEGSRPDGKMQYPRINVMLATHNLESVAKARALRDAQPIETRQLVPLTYAQLQGMADEVSMQLLQPRGDGLGNSPQQQGTEPESPQVFKYVVSLFARSVS